jgi:hypothetical protein
MPEQYLPQSLKGADLVVYTALNSFGIQVDVLSVMIEDQHESDDSDDSEDQGCRHRKGRSFIHKKFQWKGACRGRVVVSPVFPKLLRGSSFNGSAIEVLFAQNEAKRKLHQIKMLC